MVPIDVNNDHQILVEPQCLLYRWEMVINSKFFGSFGDFTDIGWKKQMLVISFKKMT